MDCILLNKLVFHGCHGITEEERSKTQRIKVSVRVNLDLSEAARADRIEQALNYTMMRKEIQHLVETQSFNLIESMAATINNRLLGFRDVESVRTVVTKLDIRGQPTVIMKKAKPSPA
jgi:dihydroneopterin aldolase